MMTFTGRSRVSGAILCATLRNHTNVFNWKNGLCFQMQKYPFPLSVAIRNDIYWLYIYIVVIIRDSIKLILI